MKNENLSTWTTALRDPSLFQVSGRLAEIDEHATSDKTPTIGFCCLGVGEKVRGGTVSEPQRVDPDFGDQPESDMPWDLERLGITTPEGYAVSELPSLAFHHWLGLKTAGSASGEADVQIDWPTGDEAYFTPRDAVTGFDHSLRWSCSELNDSLGLTFPQIADILDYFGVRDE